MEKKELKPGDIVRHALFPQASHMIVIRKLGESAYACRHFNDGQFFYHEFEDFELEKIVNPVSSDNEELISPS